MTRLAQAVSMSPQNGPQRSAEPADDSFEARWERWQLKGREGDARTRRQMKMWGVAAAFAAAAWVVWLLAIR